MSIIRLWRLFLKRGEMLQNLIRKLILGQNRQVKVVGLAVISFRMSKIISLIGTVYRQEVVWYIYVYLFIVLLLVFNLELFPFGIDLLFVYYLII
jgi:hypothetical protein